MPGIFISWRYRSYIRAKNFYNRKITDNDRDYIIIPTIDRDRQQ